MKKRVIWVDILKYISIMFVMFCHTDFNSETIEKFYTNFFLYAFFFASGYVYKNKVGFKDFIIKKAKGILVPWFCFGLINILLSQVMSNNEHLSLEEEVKYFFLQIRGLNDKMWFLSALFMAFLPFYFMIKKYEQAKNKDIAIKSLLLEAIILSFISRLYTRYMNPDLLPWKLVGLPWHLEYIFVATLWMVLGYLFKQCWESYFDEKIPNYLKWMSVPLAIIIVYVPFFSGIENGLVRIILNYITELLCIIGCIIICKKIKPNKYFMYVGQNTLIYLGIHGKVMSLGLKVMQVELKDIYYAIISNVMASTVIGIIFTIALSLVLIVPTYIINKWLPFLIGKPLK